ncbi:SRPBCC family protein [Edaphocola aurantiacus]|uniref:SRPBCC family protein n=1 Tax=Edaphocola aurantiacus TaxID=2601682 RepID=UPI001C9444BD|nr:SRPBCC family protein [Edaphocola aurantiacus]
MDAIVETQMMIRRPVAEVFRAFIAPAITTKFWFTKSSGPLETGKTITWEWEMYSVTTEVQVLEIVPDRLIATVWGDPATKVDYIFTALNADQTYVVIKNYGFELSDNELLRTVMDSTGGFTTVLDGMKAYLEHGIQLNLIADKFPGNIPS